MATIADLEQEIEKLKQRNTKVEAGKAWEESWTRKIIIVALTYIVISLFFLFTNLPNPFINSIVPSAAFVLSTLSLSFFKNLWLKYIYKK